MYKNSLLAIGLAGLVSAAQAGDFNDDRFYAAPFASYIHTGGDRDAKDGWGGGLGIGKIINQFFNVELRGFYQSFGGHPGDRLTGLSPTLILGGSGGRWDLTGGTAEVQFYLMRDTFSPYTVLGLGGMNTSVPGRSGATFIGEAGVGLTYELLDNLLLRSDVRYRYNYDTSSLPNEDQYHDLVVNAGFVIPFGDKPGAAPASAPRSVAKLECAGRDSDGDGVNDCDDRCPGTLKDTKVDEVGCPIRIELRGVNFKYDSAELTEGAKGILDGVSESLIAYPQKKDIEVKGHTSSEGTTRYNQKLSERRSASVVSYLKQKGVSNRLVAKGYGEDYPVADNSTEQGRSQNRRVEMVWMSE